ncbi:type I polyketide synthase [Streptomyces lancefieldiae]|uniref:SDR family NAD(P)-dependent oxidoreductase n=1 Tax=Streptomyces lancefieldiae TaxID=3075520 RepID=A0ABU3ARN5_9ACTN|nr:SDR family NAD(P)-dependent oxidoreductase [Streptomyces sp. DSM 40712]MDT0612242.1 SDR family NAD(P)-dependent oxidoreductase [Streptomyces sp. DSM 40712]
MKTTNDPDATGEPIAVVGMSCRLPKAATPDQYWQLLRDGRDAVGEAPPDRWAGTALPHRFGAFLDDIAGFDAGFFGVSPREAAAMDPQQRLLLELSWEALEHARIVPARLRGTATGVYVGAMWDDYATVLLQAGTDAIDQHTMAGTGRGVMANRVSHALGLRGPSMTVDTAQSSSLVAVHLACESLRRGESTTALAGGVNLNILAETTLGAARFGGLSPSGRCFTFDARADGYARGEGGALLVLKTLSDALADGDEIHSVILGGAVNNDGGDTRLTVPSAAAQRQVLEEAHRQAGVDPSDIQYVELHGTGTKVGDPVEARALGAALGAHRPPDQPLPVGSAKTNIGHLEGAAGIAGLLKVVLSIRHRQLPPSLHFERANPEIPLSELCLRVQTELGGWPSGRRLLAGVSSFGMGGTNCHLVLAEPPARDSTPRSPSEAEVPWLVSAPAPDALRAQASTLLSWLDAHPDAEPRAVGLSLALTRTHFEHRAVVRGTSLAEYRSGLADLAEGRPSAGTGTDWLTGLTGGPADFTDLPTYTFTRQRHWVGEKPPEPRAAPKDLLELVRTQVAIELGFVTGESIDPELAFDDLGVDSVGLTEISAGLSRATGLRVTYRALFRYPTPTLLAGFLREELAGTRPPEPLPAFTRPAVAPAPPADAPVTGASAPDAPVAGASAPDAPVTGAPAPDAPVTGAPAPDAPPPHDPIVVVGMACRYPGGVRSPEDLWQLVDEGRDAITPFPTDRGWDLERLYDLDPDTPGTSYTRHGGFLHDADRFDADFFGISPREAAAMDPQQRLLLEVSWEGIERTGTDPTALRGSRVGVFVGATSQEYGPRLHAADSGSEGYRLTGSTVSVLSGRIAYTLGLLGPAVTVDTACSSSLVAVHLATQALRQGECTLALAGGVTVMANPGMFVEFSRQRGLAPDGRCKPFSANADGTAWAEGAGLLVLERLSDARRNGHRVHAVLAGSAINSDGASNGLTAPNVAAQESLIRQALAAAGLAAHEIDAVEAHGTGTTLGDPIEAEALLSTYGQGRPAGRPLWLGSLKSNIGHSQAAAGVAGLIKMITAMRHGSLPRTLHADAPSPHVDWSTGDIALLREAVPWPSSGRPRRAGVSSFGISGTNAHVILQEPPADGRPQPPRPAPGAVPLVLSAKDDDALRELAARLSALDAEPVDLAFSLAISRTAFPRRAAIVAEDRAGLRAALSALAEDRAAPGVLRTSAKNPGGTAFLFTGQGSQRVGMGSGLYVAYPAFADALDEVCALFDPHLDRSLREVMFTDGSGLLDRTRYTQAALFALEVALFRLVEHWGLRPDHLLGHSVGGIVAAHVGGALSLPDAVRLVEVRGRLMQALPAGGAMFAVRAPAEEVATLLDGHEDSVGIAAVNGPNSVVISGDEGPARRIAEQLGGRIRRLRSSHAFHSPHMAAMLDDFRRELGELPATAPHIPVVSDLTGDLATAEQLGSPDYWARHVRETVRFEAGLRHLDAQGTTGYLELGPDAVLAVPAGDAGTDATAVAVPALRHDWPETETLAIAVAHLNARGVPVDWPAYFTGREPRQVELPTYPFQRRRFWLTGAAAAAAGHPWLTDVTELADEQGWLATGRLSAQDTPWLSEHVVAGRELLPAVAFAELALHVADRVGAGHLAELTVEQPLIVSEADGTDLQVVVRPVDPSGQYPFTVFARDRRDTDWTRHATGALHTGTAAPQLPMPAQWPPAGAEPMDLTDAYPRLAELGYDYGPGFQGLRNAWRSGAEVYAEVELAADPGRFDLHPALLDPCLHPVVLGLLGRARTGLLPFSFTGVTRYAVGASAVRVRLTTTGDDTVALTVSDTAGNPVLAVTSLTLLAMDTSVSDALHTVEWVPHATDGTDTSAGVRTPVIAETTLSAGIDAGIPAADVLLVDCTSEQPSPDVVGRAHALTAGLTALIQDWLAQERFAGTRLAVLTGGAVAVSDDTEIEDPSGAAVWGLVRTARLEHPGRFLLIDTQPGDRADVRAVLTRAADEPESALRDGRLFVPRVRRLRPAGDEARTLSGTVLITGGTGALGGLLARHLVTAHGVRDLVLAGRSGRNSPGAAELEAELTGSGATVTVAACDAADPDALAELLATLPDLDAVVHAAGVLDDAVLTSITPEQIDTVLRPKVDAVVHLDRLTRDRGLSAFVVFSSAVAALGNPGQAVYAAANAFLDAFARHRRAQGRPALSLGWGLWADGLGMAGHLSAAEETRVRRGGLGVITAEEGLALFDAALSGGHTHVLPARLTRRHPARSTPVPGDGLPGLFARPEPERARAVLDFVRTEVAALLGHPDPGTLDPDRSFKDLGFDSLTGVDFRNRLHTVTGLRLPATVVFEHPTPSALAGHLLDEITGTGSAAGEPDRTLVATATATATATDDDPIVIVGMACRYPGGVRSPEDLWRLVVEGTDAVSGFPADRGWDLAALHDEDPTKPGTSHTRHGGFLHDAADFDASFFGIGPREALATDPQQRLLLETAWEGLEHAGIVPASLRGSDTGVFTGVMYHDYAGRLLSAPDDLEGHLLIGNQASVASGRVAYVLGCEGPAVTVDTACSSSLVALHLAAQALRSGECSLALAGGVAVMATPHTFIEFSRQGALSPDGRCKSYADAADGTGWSEGVGMLVVERLSDARRNGHRVLAVLRGSAVNQDGASNGLTAPNGMAQQRVIRRALADAGLTPPDVDAVEGHGTGTRLGDPVEVQALLATYGRRRPADRPLWLGSVKSNLGHTQAAAGVAGVIKMVQAMRYGVLPRTLHVDRPTSQAEWSTGSLRLLTEPQPWPGTDRPRRAAVSSFGVSGTNAHVVLEAPQPADTPAPAGRDERAPVPWALSAKSPGALRAQAARLLDAVDERDVADVALSLATTRTVFEHRAVVVGADRARLRAGLAGLAEGRDVPGVLTGAAGEDRRVVFVFPGQGAAWAGMAAELLDASPVFADRMAECATALSQVVDWSLLEVVRDGSALDRVDVAQPTLFAVMVSLAELWRSYGVTPAAVVGHSQGEIAAACVAGALSLADATRIVAERSTRLRPLSGAGGMLSVALPPDEVRQLLEPFGDGLSIAAVNGPQSVVVSGDLASLDELERELSRRGRPGRRVRATDIAYHSAHVEPLREELETALAAVAPRAATVPFHSTVTGRRHDTSTLDAAYWYRNLREPVRFAETVRDLVSQGLTHFVEVSPHPVLMPAVQDIVDAAGVPGAVIPSLRRDDGGPQRFLTSLAEAQVRGIPVDWTPAVSGGRRIDLPTYAFQHRRYWLEQGTAPTADPADHPLLSGCLVLADGEGLVLTGDWSRATHPWLADHTVLGSVVVPGAALMELAVWAGDRAGCDLVEELVLQAPLVLPEGGTRVQVRVGAADGTGRRALTVHSRSADGEWRLHAEGALATSAGPYPVAALSWPPVDAEPVEMDGLYERFADIGLDYGPAFRGLRKAWRRDAELFAEVELPHGVETDGFGVHPALLDAALHVIELAAVENGTPLVPFSWNGFRLHATGASVLRVRLRPTGTGGTALTAVDRSGAPVISVDSLSTRPPAGERPGSRVDSLYRVNWVERTPAVTTPSTARWAVIGVSGALPGEPFADLDAAAGAAPDVVLAVCPASGDVVTGLHESAHWVLSLLRSWITDERLSGARLVIVTRGVMGPGDNVAAAPVWGLVRSAQAEHPDRFVLADLDDHEATGAVLPAALDLGEPQLVIRQGTVRAPRLEPAPAETAVPPTDPGATASGSRIDPGGTLAVPPMDPEGTILITGAPGALGSLVARHLVTRHGARHLLLASRRGPEGDNAAALEAELTALGAEVRVAACDVSDRAALAALLATVAAEHPLVAVVHAAGVLDDGVISSLTDERMDRVLRPKADAAWWLHELTRECDLSAFILFSSVVGTLGNPGQSSYGAANAFLDALAELRRGQGLAAQSLAWGLWAEAGGITERLDPTELRRRLARSGVAALSTSHGLALFDAGLGRPDAVLVTARLDTAAARPAENSPLLRGLIPAPARRVVDDDAAGPSLAERLAALPQAARERTVTELVQRQTAQVLGHDRPDAVRMDQPFNEIGFDSLSAVQLRNRLGAATGLRIPASVVFDHPTPLALATHLRGELLGGRPPGEEVPATRGPGAVPAADEPIAIIGMACRFPGGVRSPEDLWELLLRGGDAIDEFPTDRGWDIDELYHPDPDRPGKTYTRTGGFLYDSADFDPQFFGISPREALSTDPQQRLLLETSWEAFERAGIDPETVRGSQTGVFAGMMHHDYGSRLREVPEELEAYVGIGSAGGVASGRVAYTFGLEGPAVTVDTACSSSLVALHLAAQALRNGECSLALAGGATVMSRPSLFVEFSRQRALSPDGRCKSFAEGADGTGWAEGVGMLLVERLSDARRNGHTVYAVIRGSAVNQDGASNGMTAPNGPAQQRVIRQALAAARLSGPDVDVVEAHGTGTALGDPIEAQALLATYGRDRERPLWLGSVKSNIGHTQAAAGVAGIIKTVLALRHATLPRTLHADTPTSHVDWSAGSLRLLTETRPWPEEHRPRRAAVSSFGIGGTNAHVVLEQAPADARAGGRADVPRNASTDVRADAAAPLPWILSARTEPALRAQAARLLPTAHSAVQDIGYSLATTRRAFEHRAVVLGTGSAAMRRGLAALAEGEASPSVVQGVADTGGQVAFVFPGQGSQWPGMASELLDSSPVFRQEIEACAEALEPYIDWSLTDVLRDGRDLDRVDVVQPALFAMMAGLAALWRSHGVRPAAVAGHSQGEIAAAYVAGALSLPDAARVVALRSRALATLSGRGGMVSVALPLDQVRARAETWGERLSVAAVNGPSSVVLSGDPEALDGLLARCEADGVRVSRVAVDYASHSAHVEEVREQLLTVLAPITPRPAEIPLHSTVTGEPIDTTAMDAEYWYRNLRRTVRLDEVVRGLAESGIGAFIEVSPHPVLTAAVQESVGTAAVIGSLRRDDGGPDRFLTALAQAYVRGVELNWSKSFAGSDARLVDLPTYPFQRQRYWLPSGGQAPADDAFWTAVDSGDVDELGRTLSPDADRDPEALRTVMSVLSAYRRQQREASAADSWRYRIAWRPVSGTPAASLSGTWLVVLPLHGVRPDWAGGCVAALTAAGARVVQVEVDAAGTGRQTLAARLRDAVDTPVDGVLSLLALDERPSPVVPAGFTGTVALLQALGDAGLTAPLWCATRGAVAVSDGEPLASTAQALVWGLGLVAGVEHPDRWGGLVDLPETMDVRAGAGLRALLAATTGEDQAAVRPSGVSVRRLVRAGRAPESDSPWSPRGTVLVTGGTGALGAQVARWLAREGAEHLVLVSRRGPDAPGAPELEAQLTGLGARVTLAACDVSDRAALAELLAAVPDLAAVVHTAAVLDDGPVDTLTPDQLDRALRVKMGGALNLHDLTRDRPLSAFVMFSSFGGTIGLPGQGNYAPGNAFLDALARHRGDLGLPATSVAWGAWAGDGMAGGAVAGTLRRHGLPEMEPEPALTAMGRALAARETYVAVADVDWRRFHAAFTALRPSPLLREVPEVREITARTAAAAEGDSGEQSLAGRLTALSEEDRAHLLLDLVGSHVAAVLGHARGDVATDRAFQQLGLDSVTGVELRNRLGAATGLTLPATAVFDHPTPTALAAYLASRFADGAGAPDDALDQLAQKLSSASTTERAHLTMRLRSLLVKWGDSGENGTDPAESLRTAEDDELFSFIDKDLGVS